LTACASAPQVTDKSITQFDDPAPAVSPLVTLATSEPNSGIRLLADPSEALQSRLQLAALATTTLDIQYYLWQSDNSGLALTHEVLQAADRGVTAPTKHSMPTPTLRCGCLTPWVTAAPLSR
jgi:putative cardiolipin synthase